jgi:hypothetical protein
MPCPFDLEQTSPFPEYYIPLMENEPIPLQASDYRQRRDTVIAMRVEVAIIFLEFLSVQEAFDYLTRNGVPDHVIQRIIDPEAPRRPKAYYRSLRL